MTFDEIAAGNIEQDPTFHDREDDLPTAHFEGAEAFLIHEAVLDQLLKGKIVGFGAQDGRVVYLKFKPGSRGA